MPLGLGIDAGGSATRWLLLDGDGTVVGRGAALPLTGHLFTDLDRKMNLHRLTKLLGDVRKTALPDAVVAGVTGAHAGTSAAGALRDVAAQTLGIEPSRVRITNDMDIAYASVFRPGEGVLVYAGTGSVGYHLRADLTVVTAGGYGHLVDDEGAGYWVGREGLKQTLRWADESGSPAQRPLAEEVYRVLGSNRWEDIVAVLYRGGRAAVAAVAPAVGRAAQGGDERAGAILEQAGAELARLARTILQRVGKPLPVILAGGLTELGNPLLSAFGHALPPRTSWRVAPLHPSRAAATAALALAGDEQS